MVKRWIDLSILLILLSFSLVVISCSREESKREGKIFIRFSAPGAVIFNEFRTQMGNDFEKKHPEVRVRYEGIPGDYTSKILTQIAGRAAPDVFTLGHSNLPTFVSKGTILDITNLVRNDKSFDLDGIYPQAIGVCSYKGRLYGLPRNMGTAGIFYNRKLFDEANVDYPDGSWTWNDFLETAKKLTKRGSHGRVGQFGAAFNLFGGNEAFFIKQNGGKFWNKDRTECLIDSPETREAIQFLKDLIVKHHVCPQPQEERTQTAHEAFGAGRIGMYLTGSWYTTRFRKIRDLDWHVAPLPSGKVRACPLGAGVWCISSQSKYPQLAYELIKFLARPEAIRFVMQVGDCIPFWKYDSETEYYLELSPPPNGENQVFIDALEYSYEPYDEFGHPNIEFNEMMTVFGQELEKFMLDMLTADEALKNIKRKWERMAAE